LNHPDPETVQRAVWILGRLKSAKAVAPLSDLFGKTDAPLLKMEILATLEEIASLDAIEAISTISVTETGIVK
jgi:HEAT repeat protein